MHISPHSRPYACLTAAADSSLQLQIGNFQLTIVGLLRDLDHLVQLNEELVSVLEVFLDEDDLEIRTLKQLGGQLMSLHQITTKG